MKFNPLRDHENYQNKDPRDMSLDELRMLLKIKRMDLELGWLDFQGKLNLWQRIGRSLKQSGVLDKIQETFKTYVSSHQTKE